LSAFGIRIDETPIFPERIVELIRAATTARGVAGSD
jgi:hypothetical protein